MGETNKKALVGFILSLIGLLVPLMFILSIIGLFICISSNKKKKSGLATAGIIISLVGIILSLIIFIAAYFLFFYLPETEFQENKIGIKLSPLENNARLEEDLEILMKRFFISSGRVEGGLEEEFIVLNISREDFENGKYKFFITPSLFEAKIGDDVVFRGGNEDIIYVGKTGQDALITECFAFEGGESCIFRFTVFLSEDAAQRQADITNTLTINGSYLSKKLDFFIDGQSTSSLNIGTSLKGVAATQITISGSGSGNTRLEALENTEVEMEKLQSVLSTGSLSSDYNLV